MSNVILVGVRDIDPFEQKLIDEKRCSHVPCTKDFCHRLEPLIHGCKTYVHIDCDVLNPGIVPTDYEHPGGLSLEDIYNVSCLIADHDPIGFEIAEFQNAWAKGQNPVSPEPLINAFDPLIRAVAGR